MKLLALLPRLTLTMIFLSGCEQPDKPLSEEPAATVSSPMLFAEGIISTGNVNDELFPTFTPDGNTIYFVRRVPDGQFTIMQSELQNGTWSVPKTAPFSGEYSDQEPFVSPDGNKVFFTSNRPIDGTQPIAGRDIWFVEREGESWSEPRHIGSPVSLPPPPADADDRFLGLPRGPRVDENGTLYFWAERPGEGLGHTDLYRSRLENGSYGIPENLGPPVNSVEYETSVFMASNGDFLLFSKDCPECPGSYGASDLYISRRGENGWMEPINLGPEVNSSAYDFGPIISPDGLYLFFSSNRAQSGDEPGRQNIYFVSLDGLLPE